MEVSTNYFSFFTAPTEPALMKDHIVVDYKESLFERVKRIALELIFSVLVFITCNSKSFDFRVSTTGVYGVFSLSKVDYNYEPQLTKDFIKRVRVSFRTGPILDSSMKKLDLNKMASIDRNERNAFEVAYKQGLPHEMFEAIQSNTCNACASILENASKRGLAHIEYQFFPIKGANHLSEMKMVAPLSIDETKIPDLRDLLSKEYGLEVGKWHKTKIGYELSVKIDWRAGTKNKDAIYLYEEFIDEYPHSNGEIVCRSALEKLNSLAHVEGSEGYRKMLTTIYSYYANI